MLLFMCVAMLTFAFTACGNSDDASLLLLKKRMLNLPMRIQPAKMLPMRKRKMTLLTFPLPESMRLSRSLSIPMK